MKLKLNRHLKIFDPIKMKNIQSQFDSPLARWTKTLGPGFMCVYGILSCAFGIWEFLFSI